MTLGVVKPPACVRRETAEQFSSGQNDQVRRRKTETTRERAQDKIDILQRLGADQFAEAFDFALGLEINDDARFIFAPFDQSLGE